jgi:hypothetical protein
MKNAILRLLFWSTTLVLGFFLVIEQYRTLQVQTAGTDAPPVLVAAKAEPSVENEPLRESDSRQGEDEKPTGI